MYTPNNVSAMAIDNKRIEKAIKELDSSFEKFHGWYMTVLQ